MLGLLNFLKSQAEPCPKQWVLREQLWLATSCSFFDAGYTCIPLNCGQGAKWSFHSLIISQRESTIFKSNWNAKPNVTKPENIGETRIGKRLIMQDVKKNGTLLCYLRTTTVGQVPHVTVTTEQGIRVDRRILSKGREFTEGGGEASLERNTCWALPFWFLGSEIYSLWPVKQVASDWTQNECTA